MSWVWEDTITKFVIYQYFKTYKRGGDYVDKAMRIEMKGGEVRGRVVNGRGLRGKGGEIRSWYSMECAI